MRSLGLTFISKFSQKVYKERQKEFLKNAKHIIKIRKLNDNYYQTILALSKEKECKEKADKILRESIFLKDTK
jgi:hypothetical protein